ncbi:MAG: hypothetical protein HY919_09115 [Elusimicrobia bacterium]|nr:hypothetical protein [Elusimicrobiota bacterium]
MENKPVSGGDRLSDVKRTLDVAKQSFALELARQRERFTKEFDARNKEIRDLKLQIDALNADWQSKLKDKERQITEHLTSIGSLEGFLQQLQKLLKDKETKIETLTQERAAKKDEFEKQLNEKNVIVESSRTKIRNLEEDLLLVKTRLQEEQNKWEEILQMKEKDFGTLKKEMEKKIKEWEQEYQKEEAGIQNIQNAKLKVEEELTDTTDRMKQMELGYKEKLLKKDSEIMMLKEMLDANERSWQKRLGDLEIDSWQKEMDALVKSSAASMFFPDEKETKDKDEETK